MDIADTLNNILATELLATVEGCDHREFELAASLEQIKNLARSKVNRMGRDRAFIGAYETVRDLVKSGDVAKLCAGIRPAP
jgi:histidine ammonia-lyase